MEIFIFHVILFFFLLDVVPSIALEVCLHVQKNQERKKHIVPNSTINPEYG